MKHFKNKNEFLNESDFDDLEFEKKWKEITEPKPKVEDTEPEIDEELKIKIIEYTEENFTEDWFNSEFSERCPDYVDEDELEEYDDNYEEAYKAYCNGGAIEYDLIGEIDEELQQKFDLDWDTANYFTMLIFHKNCDWKDKLIF